VKDVVGLGCETTQELRMKEPNATLNGFRELLTDCVLIYEGAVVAILLHEFVLSNQVVKYFATKPTCGSSTDASLGLVPLRPGWPCLDTDSTTMIVSLPGEFLNLGRTVLVFLVFSFEQTF